ncbi:MAG: ammonium transporter [Eubacteriaceae bacterium]|nr:ammonium transporter [Eubacteriaceae bacterium]
MNNNSAKDKALLIITLIICVVAGILLCASVNPNVAESMKELAGSSFDATALTGESHTIFETLQYNRSIHVLAMLLLGFGFLMVCVRGHGFSSLTATLLVTSISIPVYLIIKSFVGEEAIISVESLLWAEFCGASILIAIGAPLGRLKMSQYVLMAFLFTIVYFVNEWLIVESGVFAGFQDTGGSVVIHAFGAYFGLGVITKTQKNFEGLEATGSKMSNQFSMLGSLVLWVFWPSFTSAIVAPDRVTLTAINTVLALAGATLATYVVSKLVGKGKLDIEHIANAALAGGVAIGSTCDIASPGMSLLIGLCAGTLSTIGYSFIAPRVCRFIGGTDTCGVHNLHGMPGLLGGLSAIIITGNWQIQLLGMVVTVAIAYVGGGITGLILRCFGRIEKPYSDESQFHMEEITEEK